MVERIGSPKIPEESSGKSSPISSPNSSPKTEDRIIELLRQNSSSTTEELGKSIGISKRGALKQIDKLKEQGRLRRIGPARGGYWEVIEKSEG
jgi:ATP-dependent DNA helicase RecG